MLTVINFLSKKQNGFAISHLILLLQELLDKICTAEIVVTLTTYGRRLYDVYLAFESIMQGSLKPNYYCPLKIG